MNLPHIKTRDSGKTGHVSIDFFSANYDLKESAFRELEKIYEPYLKRLIEAHKKKTVWVTGLKEGEGSITFITFEVLKEEKHQFLENIKPVIYNANSHVSIKGHQNV
jgi:hypothetical protein